MFSAAFPSLTRSITQIKRSITGKEYFESRVRRVALFFRLVPSRLQFSLQPFTVSGTDDYNTPWDKAPSNPEGRVLEQ